MARVKRAEALVIPDPHTIGPGATLAAGPGAMERRGVTGLVVVDDEDRLRGHPHPPRRAAAAPTPLTPVSELMTPRERLVIGGAGDDRARRPPGCCATRGWRSSRWWTRTTAWWA